MNRDTALLQAVYHNAKMGEFTIPPLIARTKSVRFRQALQSQLREYKNVEKEARDQLLARGQQAKDISPAEKSMSKMMLRVKAALDPSAQHVAKMMIQGSTMGTIQITQKLHEYAGVTDPTAVRVANHLLKTEEANIQQLKNFL